MKYIKKFKKWFVFTLVLGLCAVILLNFPEIKAEIKYARSATPMGAGVKNIYLSYISESHLTVDDYVSILNYVEEDGTITENTFMDTIILLPAAPYSNTLGLGRESTVFDNTNIESGKQTFKTKYMVEQSEVLRLIDDAASEIEKETGEEKTVNIIFSSFLPNVEKNEELTKFFVDTQKKDFEDSEYKNLKLIGFYYYIEAIFDEKSGNTRDDKGAEVYFNNYVHGLDSNYKTIWIPYIDLTEKNWENGYNYGFDYINIQSNYYFSKNQYFENYNTSYGVGRIGKADEIASTYKFGVEVEFDADLFASGEHYSRYIDFLKAGVSKGWNQAINVYYDAYALVTACASNNDQDRDICDLTHKYASGALKLSDLEGKAFSIEYPGKYSLISKGDSISFGDGLFAGSKCTSTTTNAYCNVDGNELTDGVYALDSSGWVLYRRGDTTKDYYEIVIDLGKKETSVSYFGLEMIKKLSWGLGTPENIEFFYSNDGSNYQKLGDGIYYDKAHGERAYAYLELGNAVDARYIKAKFDKGPKTFIGLSEFTVGKTATVDLESSSGNIYLGRSNMSVKVVTKDAGTLSVTSGNNNIATCSLSNGNLVINGISKGSTMCEVKEASYGVSEVYSVVVKEDKVKKLSIKSEPSKKEYIVNEENLDLTGGVLSATWDSGYNEEISMKSSDVEVLGFDNSSVGEKTVTVKYNGVSVNFEINVVAKVVDPESISLNKNNLTLKVGKNETLTATVAPVDATNKVVLWSSSDTTVATVDSNGKVSALKEGTAKITATIANTNIKTEANVVVEEVKISGISIYSEPTKLTYVINEDELDLSGGKIKVSYDDGSSTIMNFDNNEVTVSGFDNSSLGDKTIVVQYKGFRDSFIVSVVEKENEVVVETSVELNETELSLKVGESFVLVANVMPLNATNRTVTYESSDSSVVTVDNEGNLIALAEGEVVITVKTNSGLEERCSVIVRSDVVNDDGSSGDDNSDDEVIMPGDEPSEEDVIDNPSTGVSNIYVLCLVGTLLAIVTLVFIKRKKYI